MIYLRKGRPHHTRDHKVILPRYLQLDGGIPWRKPREGWHHNYEISVEDNGEGLATLHLGDGRIVPYRKSIGNLYTPLSKGTGLIRQEPDGYCYTAEGIYIPMIRQAAWSVSASMDRQAGQTGRRSIRGTPLDRWNVSVMPWAAKSISDTTRWEE